MKETLEDSLARLFGPLDKPHDRLRAELLGALPQAVPNRKPTLWRQIGRLLTGDNTMTTRQRVLRLTPSAAVIVALALGIWLLTGRGFVKSAYAEVDEAIANTEAAEWAHIRSNYMGKESESWFSTAPPRFMTRGNGQILWIDASTRRQLTYTASTRTLKITWLPEEVAGAFKKKSFLHLMLGVFEQARTKQGAKIERRRETVGNNTYLLYTLTLPQKEQVVGLRVDPTTKRIVSMSAKDASGLEFRVDVDYPQSGPADIYALGVPRNANQPPPKSVLDLDQKVRDARKAFAPSYYAITCQSGQSNLREGRYVSSSVQAIYKKGEKFRIEEYGNVHGAIGKNAPVYDMKALEAWRVGRAVHRVSLITGLNTHIGTIVSLDRDGKLTLRRNAGVPGTPVELLNWGLLSPPTIVRIAPPGGEEGNVGLERTMEAYVMHGRVITYPCRERMYFEPGRDYIARYRELLWDAQGNWQKDMEWLKKVKDPAARTYRSRRVTKVLEYAKTAKGHWYARKILREVSGQNAGKAIRVVYLDTEREIRDDLFDPNSVTRDLSSGQPSAGAR